MDGHELRVNIGQVDQRHIAERLEREKVLFAETLLGREPAETAGRCSGQQGRGTRSSQKIAA
jgi:hypothetical protein